MHKYIGWQNELTMSKPSAAKRHGCDIGNAHRIERYRKQVEVCPVRRAITCKSDHRGCAR
ncbi:hypothetical protein [Vibrio sp. HB161653]|uniref:hypothetical protein n=1 Tax=Vibrio sp. HB161653 TaxID=3068274 RepID=UPI00273E2D92|nr:hypothetical protein [Vibrio sp. HB161653]MDP5255227.1 hypothetical protein [Vibrio sp. HB161653]